MTAMDDRFLGEFARYLDGQRQQAPCDAQLDLTAIEGLIKGTLNNEDAQRAGIHLRGCLSCLNAYAELLSLLEEPAEASALASTTADPQVITQPKPRFASGDVVQRAHQPEAVGVIRDIRWDRQAESWNYAIQFGAQLRVLPEESIESLRAVASPWIH